VSFLRGALSGVTLLLVGRYGVVVRYPPTDAERDPRVASRLALCHARARGGKTRKAKVGAKR
jgi:hypothetical protein